MDSTWEISASILSVQLQIISGECIKYLKDKGLTDRRTKSKIIEASKEFEEIYRKHCELKEIGKVDFFETNLMDKLMMNFENDLKLEALDMVLNIVKDTLEHSDSDRISMLKFYEAVREKAQEYSTNLLNGIRVYTRKVFRDIEQQGNNSPG